MIVPLNMERKITPMFKVGKNIAESSNPARIVLRRLQHPKNKPINAANVTVEFPRGGAVLFRVINAVSRERIVATAKAISRNAPLSSG